MTIIVEPPEVNKQFVKVAGLAVAALITLGADRIGWLDIEAPKHREAATATTKTQPTPAVK